VNGETGVVKYTHGNNGGKYSGNARFLPVREFSKTSGELSDTLGGFSKTGEKAPRAAGGGVLTLAASS
jgi:hypothetical protein